MMDAITHPHLNGDAVVIITELARLLGTARGVVLGIEIEHQPSPPVAGKVVDVACMTLDPS
jgi:hypothetical protein